ncbi:unnamed protein product [Gadus morhua 'NCC']
MEPEMSKAVAMKCQGCWTDPRTGLTEGYMASGDSLVSLAYSYRLGHTKVRNSVHMSCAGGLEPGVEAEKSAKTPPSTA